MENPKPVSPRSVILLGIGLVLLIMGLVFVLIILLPEQIPFKATTKILNFHLLNTRFELNQEQRFMILIGISGGIGSTIHAATSFSKYLGQRRFYSSWIWWYLLRPFVGGLLALVTYFVIRGGVLVNGHGLESVSLFGMLAIASLTGMFSKQAIDKLNQVFNQIFKNGDDGQVDNLMNNNASM